MENTTSSEEPDTLSVEPVTFPAPFPFNSSATRAKFSYQYLQRFAPVNSTFRDIIRVINETHNISFAIQKYPLIFKSLAEDTAFLSKNKGANGTNDDTIEDTEVYEDQ